MLAHSRHRAKRKVSVGVLTPSQDGNTTLSNLGSMASIMGLIVSVYALTAANEANDKLDRKMVRR